jgi:DNA repair protein RadC
MDAPFSKPAPFDILSLCVIMTPMNYLKELKIKYVPSKIKNPLRGQIQNTQELVELFKDLSKEDKEKVVSIHFNARMQINCFEILSIGGVDLAFISPRDVFKGVLLTNSTGFILLHNHPTGDPTPSDNDVKMIEQIQRITKDLEVVFIDFVIIGDKSKFWSWRFDSLC